ncbi:hypothetical protein ANANG_G00234900 [Anguilla anguilla]|uniref:Uncharacterized protein n=1 Tax=Anguilla anguilla TaxID=7936 RepID=A0A9D3RNP1_ANGAN|nr:hypothetical protein ANANG_G00234900 [Anguilla anguilla]
MVQLSTQSTHGQYHIPNHSNRAHHKLLSRWQRGIIVANHSELYCTIRTKLPVHQLITGYWVSITVK